MMAKSSLNADDEDERVNTTTTTTTTPLVRTATPLAWSTSALLGLQHAIVPIAGILVLPHLVADLACAGVETIALRAQLISSVLVYGGVTTLLQTTFGLRLAVLNNAAFAFIPPLIAFGRQHPDFVCRAQPTDVVPHEEYYTRLQLIAGSLAVAGLCQLLFGVIGAVGLLARRVGPLTIVPLMLMLSIGNCEVVLEKSAQHWLSLVQFALLLLFAHFCADVQVPLPSYERGLGLKWRRMRLFQTYPFLIGILLAWALALVLTKSGMETEDSAARVDHPQSLDVLRSTPWFQLPYPGQFGAPRFSIALFIGLLTSCIAVTIESIGAYETLARVAEEAPPSLRSVNRATIVQGLGCILYGLSGCSVGIAAYCDNVAVVGITRIASRRVLQCAAVVLIALGVFTKTAALLATIPQPIIGGIFAMSVCLVSGVCLSNLQNVDLRNSRNLTILGCSIIAGILIPNYALQHPIATGIESLDQNLNILLLNRMAVGGLIAFILDNISRGNSSLPASEIVLLSTEVTSIEAPIVARTSGYCFSPAVTQFLLRSPFLQKLPFMPSNAELHECNHELTQIDRPVQPQIKITITEDSTPTKSLVDRAGDASDS